MVQDSHGRAELHKAHNTDDEVWHSVVAENWLLWLIDGCGSRGLSRSCAWCAPWQQHGVELYWHEQLLLLLPLLALHN